MLSLLVVLLVLKTLECTVFKPFLPYDFINILWSSYRKCYLEGGFLFQTFGTNAAFM